MSIPLAPDSIIITENGAMTLEHLKIQDKVLNSNNEFVAIKDIISTKFSSDLVQLQGDNFIHTVIEDKNKENVKPFSVNLKENLQTLEIDKVNTLQGLLLSHIFHSKFKIEDGYITIHKSKFNSELNNSLVKVLNDLNIEFETDQKVFSISYTFYNEFIYNILTTLNFIYLPSIFEDYAKFYLDYIEIFLISNIPPTVINTTDIYILFLHLNEEDKKDKIKQLTNNIFKNTSFSTFKKPNITYDYNSVSKQGEDIQGSLITLEKGEIVFNLLSFNS